MLGLLRSCMNAAQSCTLHTDPRIPIRLHHATHTAGFHGDMVHRVAPKACQLRHNGTWCQFGHSTSCWNGRWPSKLCIACLVTHQMPCLALIASPSAVPSIFTTVPSTMLCPFVDSRC